MTATPGIVNGRSAYDVVGASEGPDLGNINPDAQSIMLRALAAHLDKISAVVMANKDAPIEQVQFEVDASNIPGGGLTYHLPSGAAVVGYYLENNSGNTISIYAGNSGASRALATAPASTFKSSPIPQQVTSVAIVSSGTAIGLVRLLISSANLGPAFGSLIGVAGSPPSTTWVSTQYTVGTAPVPILAANANRIAANIFLASGATVYLSPSTNQGAYSIAIAPYTNYSLPTGFKGSVWAVSGTAGQTVVVSEFTP